MATPTRPVRPVIRTGRRAAAARPAEPDPHGNRAQRRAAKKLGRKPKAEQRTDGRQAGAR